MTVGNPENFKVKIISSGREEVDKRVPCDFSNLTLDKLFRWIDSQQVSSLIKQELKKSASRFPHQALNNWKNNYIKHLSKAQAKVRNKKLQEKNSVIEEIEEKPIEKMYLPDEKDFDQDFEQDSGEDL